jgi:tRNA G26 N,N-dimethylase Trm1
MTDKEADQNEVSSPENYVCLQCVKSNYTKLGKSMWFKKGDLGQLEFTDLQSKMLEKIVFDQEKDKQTILEKIEDESEQNKFYSISNFSKIFGGKDGVLELSTQRITRLLKEMIKSEQINVKTEGKKKNMHINHGI